MMGIALPKEACKPLQGAGKSVLGLEYKLEASYMIGKSLPLHYTRNPAQAKCVTWS